jgi:hypothetical protein
MSESVWLSRAIAEQELVLYFQSDLSEQSKEKSIEGSKKNPLGEPLGPDLFPKTVWATEETPPGPLPDLFVAKGYWVVSEKAASILRQFDLGKGALYPVAVLKADRATPYPGDHFCWNFGNAKTALVPDQSQNLRPFGVAGLRWNLPWNPKDGDVAVSAAALGGPDVWVDPNLFKSLFVSDALGSALKGAGLAKAFLLTRSRVV